MAPKKGSSGSGVAAAADKDVWVLLLCGLPGSGKSTLRRALAERGWAYVNKDEMLTREACEKAMITALKRGQSLVIDICNVTPGDRRYWMNRANSAVAKRDVKGVRLHYEAIWMATPVGVCKARARGRQGHETVSPEQADAVIDGFCRGLRPPQWSGQEPYEGVHAVSGRGDAEVLLKRFANPAAVDASFKLRPAEEVLREAAAAAAEATAAAAAEAAESAAAAAADDEEDGAAAAAGGATGPAGSAAAGAPVVPAGLAGSAAADAPAAPAGPAAEVFVLRHGERADRARGITGGWPDDPPLTKGGREAAKRAGVALRALNSAPWAPVVYSSVYYRCLQTASEVAAELGLPVSAEPGLCELTTDRFFEAQPVLRPPGEALAAALQRAERDLSAAPVVTSPPVWPERASAANRRVMDTARALAARHPGQAVLMVCHGHSVVEITRNLPEVGGGSSSSYAPYCALSHIAPSGHLLRSLDVSYMKSADGAAGASPEAVAAPKPEAGRWADGWMWRGSDEEEEEDQEEDPVEALLDMGLDNVLATFPTFEKRFRRRTPDKQDAWRQAWASRRPSMRSKLRSKLRKAYDSGMFSKDRVAAQC